MAQKVSETVAGTGVTEPERSAATISGGHLVAKKEQKYGADRGRVGNTLGNVRYDEFARMLGVYAPGTMNQTMYT